ncbi:MAG TPA: TetR/AcrR family transcriptional regulator [Stellaceae bacterium]|jgi:AcrR family transcriptional regulator
MAARKRPKQPSGDPRHRLIAAALALAAEQGWRRTSMAEIADAAGLSLGETYRLARSKPGILAILRRQIDEAMLAGGVAGGEAPRDRLFEALMRRFEALRPYRVGVRAVLRDSVGSPAVLGFLPGLLRSMGWTLSAAGLPASGCRGHLARRVVGAVYVSILPTFFNDDGRDLGSTMAALDKRLRQVETLVSTLGPLMGSTRQRS